MRRWLGPGVVFAAFVGAWYLLHYVVLSDARAFLLPPPHAVVDQAFLTWKVGGGTGLAALAGGGLADQLTALWLSSRVAGLGLVLSIALGMGLAVVMSTAKWVEDALFPYAVAVQAMPILAFVPLIGVLFGFDFSSRVLVCVIISIFPIISNTLFGLQSVQASQLELFALAGASRWTVLWKLRLPAALPAIFAGLRISAGLSVIGAVVGDFFFRQGQPGIGQLIDRYRASLAYEQMYGSVILSALLGIAVFWAFGWLRDRAVGAWADPE